MKKEDINNIVELLKIAKIGALEREIKEGKRLKELPAISFNLPENLEEVRPIVSVDGSYSFLFSFLGADTWIVLFRIAVTDYQLEINGSKISYLQRTPLKVFDHLNLLSFADEVISSQPPAFELAKKDAEKFQTRKQIIYAANIMTYLEHKTLKKISETYKDCILLADGALVSVKKLRREELFESVKRNCIRNNILLAGISKTTSTHFFNDFYSDDYFLKKFYDNKYQDLTYIQIPDKTFDFKFQKRFTRYGQIHFAKLNKNAAKWFRVDIGNDGGDKNDLFSQIAAYSMVHLVPGYPIGLIETHKIAKSVRNFKEVYELELIESLKNIGLNADEILDGAVDIDGEHLRSFHELLDLVSK